MDQLQAKAVLVLSESRHFDSVDIAKLLNLPEADVTRIVQASRDIRREVAAAR